MMAVISMLFVEDASKAFSMTQQLVQMAEDAVDAEGMFKAYLEHTCAAARCGRPEVMMTSFARALAIFDGDRERHSRQQDRLFRAFKAVLIFGPGIPTITRHQIDQLVSQYSELLQHFGHGARSSLYFHIGHCVSFGEFEKASQLTNEFQSLPRDEVADCEACELSSIIEVLAMTKQDDECLRIAEPLLAGELKCDEVPGITYGRLLGVLRRQKNFKQADVFHFRGYERVRQSPRFLGELSFHLCHLVHRQKWDEAGLLVKSHLHWTVDSYQKLFVLQYLYAVSFYAEACPANRFPKSIGRRLEITSSKAGLQNYVEPEIASLASQFDHRNQNSYCSTNMRQTYGS